MLVLEDDLGVNLLQRRHLGRAGYQTIAATDPGAARQIIQQGGVDLIVLDYALDGLVSGVEFYRRLQADGYNLPAVLVTGFSDEAKLTEALRAGVRDFIPKTPDYIDYLAPTVERVMRQVRAERKAAEAELLRRSEERFRNSLENMLDCFGIFSAVRDPTGAAVAGFRVEYVNAAAQRAAALTAAGAKPTSPPAPPAAGEEPGPAPAAAAPPPAASLVGQPLDALEPHGHAELTRRYREVVATGQPFSVDAFLWSAPAGHAAGRWFDIRASRLGDGVAAVWRDVSEAVALEAERKQAEAERARLLTQAQRAQRNAEAANRLKDEFLATLSHELRTPLNSILGWTRILREGGLDEETARHAVEVIDRNVQVQSKLIEDLLDVSRIISGKLRLDVRQIEPAPVIRAAADSVRPAADAKGIRLELALDADTGPVCADADRLQQIVWNLLSNAIKFTPPQGWVVLALTRADARLLITVRDTGKGIDPEFLPFVFDRFRQAEEVTTRYAGGLGLGLAIVRHLVEQHGGTVQAASQGENRGASFTVSLPMPAPTPPEEAVPARDGEGPAGQQPDGPGRSASARAVLAGLRVLVVDDQVDARELVALVLRRAGAQVAVAGSAQQAREEIRRAKPDVLLSDIGMPGEDGYRLIQHVRSLAPHEGGLIPAAALTAYVRMEDRMKILSHGFQLHVPKPIDPGELIAIVTSLAGRFVQEPPRPAEARSADDAPGPD